MAFRDEQGRITVDEIAAGEDIRNLKLAQESLRDTGSRLRQVAAQAGEFSGGTGTAIMDVAGNLAGEVHTLADRAQQAAELIEATVQKYQAIDQALKSAAEGL